MASNILSKAAAVAAAPTTTTLSAEAATTGDSLASAHPGAATTTTATAVSTSTQTFGSDANEHQQQHRRHTEYCGCCCRDSSPINASSPPTNGTAVPGYRHHSTRHAEDVIGECQSTTAELRMTANTVVTRRNCRDGGFGEEKNRRQNNSADMRNLRNRPLKVATTTTTIDSEKNRSRRRRDQSRNESLTGSPQQPSIRNFFPLRTIGSVCELFRSQIQSSQHCDVSTSSSLSTLEPDLTLLSIVVGIIETKMTKSLYLLSDNELSPQVDTDDELKNHPFDSGSYSPAEATPAPTVGGRGNQINSPLDFHIPTVYYDTVSSLHHQFTKQIKESVDLSKYPKKTSRELIKKISDVVWSNLQRSPYKARTPHLQTIYSYLNGNKLDSFGMAYAVVAACQILGLDDVRLVMSEDHAWVTFGDGETCEVTWHGKGTEDKRGQPIPADSSSWLYLNGNTMVCDRFMTVATLVSAINPAINATSKDSKEIAILQQQLLWILYDYGHLVKYPMALGNLGDLEDSCAYGMPRKEPTDLLHEAIESAKKFYNDSHVYPYTYLGGYYFRIGLFKPALKAWADAAQVLKQYNYTRDDEEIYKEFQEIANDLIPDIVKCQYVLDSPVLAVTKDGQCFAQLLRFYDGLCAWEEGSSTPVLHVGWTQPLVSTISKFPYTTRAHVSIKIDWSRFSLMDSDIEEDDVEDGHHHHHQTTTIGERRRRRAASAGSNCTDEEHRKNGHHHHKQEEFTDSDLDSKGSSGDKRIRRGSECSEIKSGSEDENDDGKTIVLLSSKKFAGLRSLLTADKLNTSAIQLQLTAQSQVNVNKRSRSGSTTRNNSASAELDFVSTTTTTLSRTNSCHKRIRRD